MEVPSIETILQNLSAWQQYARDLNRTIDEASVLNRNRERTAIAVKTMKLMFSDSTPKTKEFDPTKVTIHPTTAGVTRRYTYSHDGVVMHYHCHSAWRNGDHDLRVDRRISVDGSVVLSDDG
jgi:hypothetical protein